MKKLLPISLILGSFQVVAAPYIGLEYGISTTNHDFVTKLDGRTLDPSSDGGIWGGFIGYAINDRFAIELGYNQFSLDDDQSRFDGFFETGTPTAYKQETKWDSSIKAQQISLSSVYSHNLNDKITAKAKAGLTYTQYDERFSKYQERELVLNDDIESHIPFPANNHAQKHDEIGAVLAAGVEYFVLPQASIGTNVKYQLDSYGNTLSLNFGASYYF